MVIVFLVGVIVFFLLPRGGKEIDSHMRDDAEKPAARQVTVRHPGPSSFARRIG